MQLPEVLEAAFRRELFAFEETMKMPYVTTVERAGIQKGLQQGEARMLLLQLSRKFGEATADAYKGRVEQADPERWSERILTADAAEDIFR